MRPKESEHLYRDIYEEKRAFSYYNRVQADILKIKGADQILYE